MAIANQQNQESILVPRTRSMSAVWCVASIGLVGFGLMPWIIWLTKGNGFNWIAAGVLTVWSALPISLALVLIFNSLCRIRIEVNGNEICRRKHLGPISSRKCFVTDRIQLSTHVVWGKRRRREHQVLYVYEESKQRQILLWDFECRDLEKIGKAISQAEKIE